MPVLPLEPAIFPEDLLQAEGPFWTPHRRWHGIHTRPRQEKSAARELHRAGVPFVVEVDFIQRGASLLLDDVDIAAISP